MTSAEGRIVALDGVPPRQPSPRTQGEVAIVGLAGRFPGARDVEAFWQNLCQGIDSISSFSADEVRRAGTSPSRLQEPGFVPAGGVLADVELFDAAFFEIPPREAEAIDPQQRIFLECSWEALERAGYDPATCPGRIGVFAGSGINSYLLLLRSQRELIESVGGYQTLLGNDKDFLATRVSYKLGLSGPSIAVQAACSTSLVAVHLACQSLRDGESDMALAGGVSVTVPQQAGYRFRPGRLLSPDGRCRVFDAEAAGTVRGNGVGIVVLKRLADAIADGDHIHAVIRGSAVSHSGAARAFTAPNGEGQRRVISDAWAAAGIEPQTLAYIEASGAGTRSGDAVEAAALAQAFRSAGVASSCALGSVKTNVGHLGAAAGMAGLLKTALMVEKGEIVPSLHFATPSPDIDFAAGPFTVPTRRMPWQHAGGPRRAGVSAFGFGGVNAHLVLEEPPAIPAEVGSPRPADLFLLSARSETALAAAAGKLSRWLTANPDALAADVAFTLQVGRRRFRHRLAVVSRGAAETAVALHDLDPATVATAAEDAGDRPVAFLFPGQGVQHVGMGRDLYRAEPGFRRDVDAVAERFEEHLGFDLRLLLAPSTGDPAAAAARLEQTAAAQAALFAVEYALARLYMSWGIRPQVMLGHSLGEYVAACLAGVFTLEDAVAAVATRARLMQGLPGGTMMAVSLAADELSPWLGEELSLAALNGPSLSVLSGPEEAIRHCEQGLSERGVETRRLRTSHAFHSAMMEPAVEPFAAFLRQKTLSPPQIPFVSNVSGRWITAAEATSPSYWARQLRGTVRFSDCLGELLARPSLALLEIGPGRTLSTLARQHPARGTQPVITALPQPADTDSDLDATLGALGRLWIAGARIDWRGFQAGAPRRRVPLPTYPFERRRFWVGGGDECKADERGVETAVPRVGRPGVAARFVAPRTATERAVAAIWQRQLGIAQIGAFDDFFELGGSSLMTVQLRTRLHAELGVDLPAHFLLAAPTVAAVAEAIASVDDRVRQALPEGVVELNRGDGRRPLFLVHPAGGHVYFYRELARRLERSRPVYGLEGSQATEAPAAIEEMAARYLAAVQSVQGAGPYLLGGSSMGGTIAYEMAQQLQARGERVALLALLDTPGRGQMPRRLADDAAILSYLAGAMVSPADLRRLSADAQLRFVLQRAKAESPAMKDMDFGTARRLLDLFKAHMRAFRAYRPKPYPGRVVFFRADSRRPMDPPHPERAWIDLAAGGIEIRPVPGHHISMHHSPNLEILIEQLNSCLARVEA